MSDICRPRLSSNQQMHARCREAWRKHADELTAGSLRTTIPQPQERSGEVRAMDTKGSITNLIGRVQEGDSLAAQQIFDIYFERLVGVAQRRLNGSPRAVEDEEDVVMSAMDSFIARARDQRFPKLTDRFSLWPLLLKITNRKAINLRQRHLAKKRGSGRILHDQSLTQDFETSGNGMEAFGADGPTPETIAILREQCERLLGRLKSPIERQVARYKLEGFTNAEIAQQLDVVERTVERKLRLIRNAWSREL